MLSPQRTWSFAQCHIMDGYGWHLCFCTDPRFHKATAVPCFPPAGPLETFGFLTEAIQKGYRIDGDFLGISANLLQLLYRPLCSFRKCTTQIPATCRCPYDSGPMQVGSAVQCHPFKPEETQGASLRTRAAGSHFWILPGILAHLMGNRVIMPFLVHLTKVTKICQIYHLYAQLGHCSVIHRKHTCQARDKGSSSTPYQ